jgi:hypothetical protein
MGIFIYLFHFWNLEDYNMALGSYHIWVFYAHVLMPNLFVV